MLICHLFHRLLVSFGPDGAPLFNKTCFFVGKCVVGKNATLWKRQFRSNFVRNHSQDGISWFWDNQKERSQDNQKIGYLWHVRLRFESLL